MSAAAGTDRTGLGLVLGGVVRLPDLDQLRALTGAEVELRAGSALDWEEVGIETTPPMTLRRLSEGDARFAQQQRGLVSFIVQACGGLDARTLVIVQRLQAAHHAFGLSGAPEAKEAAAPVLRSLAQQQNGLVLRDALLLDHELRVLVGAEDDPADPAAVLPVLPDAMERLEASQKRLALFELQPPPLPPLPSLEETRPRAAREVGERAQALWAVAARAGGLERAAALELLQARGLWSCATPAEQDYLLEAEHDPLQAAAFAHRKEALAVLLWALGKTDLLGPPTRPAELEGMTKVLRRHDAASFLDKAALRPSEDLLDEACANTRVHAALSLLARAGQAHATLRPEVAAERHLALSWLIRYPRGEWDQLAGG